MKTRDEMAAEYARMFKSFSDQDVAYGAFRAGYQTRESEVSELRTRLTLAESHGSIKYAYKAGCLEKELAEARAERERMRPVVEAAKNLMAWAKAVHSPLEHGALAESVEALDAKENT